MRVIVVEDQALLRDGLVRLFTDKNHDVVGSLGDTNGLVDLVTATEPDLVVLDLRMPPTFTDEGATAARTLKADRPQLGILLLSQHIDRSSVVDLVAKVARQVIRAELALQPVQLLALVDETLASMPPTREEIDVFLNPEELKRISELDPKRAKRWNLIADARLDAGECRIKAGDNEVDAGCHQRLSACMDQVSSHLALAAEHADQGAPA